MNMLEQFFLHQIQHLQPHFQQDGTLSHWHKDVCNILEDTFLRFVVEESVTQHMAGHINNLNVVTITAGAHIEM